MSTHMNQDPHTCHSLMRDTASRYTDSRLSPFSGGRYTCSHVHTHCSRLYSDLLHNLGTICIPAQNILQMQKISIPLYIYTGCPRRNVPDFGRVFLMLNYTDITQDTYVQSRTVTEIMSTEKCGRHGGRNTIRCP